MLRLIVVTLCVLILSSASFAAIYMQTDPNGNVVYSDTPLPNGMKIELPEGNTTQALQKTATVTTETTTEELPTDALVATGRKNYTTFLIMSPKPQETFQNQPIIPVTLAVEPALQKGDKIQLFLDGKPYGDAAPMTELGLSQVERGSHQVSAVIIDSNQRILKQTDAITIFVHKTSILNPPNAANSSQPFSSQSRSLVRMLFQLLV